MNWNKKTIIATMTAGMLATAAVVGGTTATRAFDQHFIECFGWMITDPDTHAANCLPSRVVPSEPGSTSKKSSGNEYDFEEDYEDDFSTEIPIDGDQD